MIKKKSTGVSTYKNAYKSEQKTHRERDQVKSLKKYGMLEKHKDYVVRAADYKKKQSKLKRLKVLARDKNPDQFYFRMISEPTVDGIHVVEKIEENSEKSLSVYQRDVNYLNMVILSEGRKAEKMRSELVLIRKENLDGVSRRHVFFGDSNNHHQDSEKNEKVEKIEKSEENEQKQRLYNEKIENIKSMKRQRDELVTKIHVLNSQTKKKRFMKVVRTNDDGEEVAFYKWKKQRQR